jgi:deazaflavin-dependent oxidoreductase (nitroreductase family)
MVETYQVSARQRRFNAILRSLTRLGIPLGPFSLLTVRGRKTGKPYTLPVAPLTWEGQRWLVSPYGEVNWVRNARLAGEVTLTHGRRQERFAIRELAPEESAPVLKAYLIRFPIVRPYFAATSQSDLAAFAAEAPRHPAFQLVDPLH